MKIFLLILILIGSAYSATCTQTTRTNYTSGQILTAASLNADLNQLVTKVNGLDGGCVTDGTIEASALNSADFATLLNAPSIGCGVSYIDTNNLSISLCRAAVNGAFVNTSTVTNATWGCSGCSSEVSSTTYYLYIKNGSSGSTLTPFISTSAPNGNGYDTSSNRVVARFYNNSASNIDPYSIYNWTGSQFTSAFAVATPNESSKLLSATITASGLVQKDYGDLINGNCTDATSSYCPTNPTFTEPPNCVITPERNNTMCAFSSTASSGSYYIACFGDDGANVTQSTAKFVHCHGR